MTQTTHIEGTLVTLAARGRKRPLDGFWVRGPKRSTTLLLLVHGMGGNFYKSVFKKELMRHPPRAQIDVLSFNNRGCENNVTDEVFTDCRHDLDAALAFGRAHGYRRFILLGHSTGCQKIVYYQHLRKAPDIAALVLAAIGDDIAIVRREAGPRYHRWIKRARMLVKTGRAHTTLRGRGCLGFSARRFLSVADPKQIEARLFDMDGALREFSRIDIPILVALPLREQYACIPIPEMARRLKAVTRAKPFGVELIPRADHSFHGHETEAAQKILRWLKRNAALH